MLPGKPIRHFQHGGFSLLEVMIAVAILATALAISLGNIYTLHQSRGAMDEDIKAQSIAQIMVERLQGATWDDLGRDISDRPHRNAWSWHRRATAQLVYTPSMVATSTPPMTEQAARGEDNLIQLGLLTAPSGVKNLAVYVEYYQSDLMDRMNERLLADTTLNARAEWLKIVGDPRQNQGPTGTLSTDTTIYLPEDPIVLNFSTIQSAVLIRVLISWESTVGGTRWHEVVIARRK